MESLRSFVHSAEANLTCCHLANQKANSVIEASIVDELIGDLFLFDGNVETVDNSETSPSKVRARALKILCHCTMMTKKMSMLGLW